MDASKRRRLLFLSPDIVRAVDSPAALLERMEPALASSTVVSLRATLDRQGAGAAIARLLGALSNASDPIVYDTFLDALRSLGHAPLVEKLDTNSSTLTPTPSSSSMKRSVCSSSSDEVLPKERRSHSDVTPPPSRFGIAATSSLPRSPSEPIGFGRPLVVGGGLRLGRSESAAALSNVDQECLLLLIGALNEGERNWKDLASLYNHTPAEIDSLDHDGARASHLIQQLVSSGMTVPNVIQRLHEIERTDASEILMKFVASKQQGMRNGNISSVLSYSFRSFGSPIPEHVSLPFMRRSPSGSFSHSMGSGLAVAAESSRKSNSLPRSKSHQSPLNSPSNNCVTLSDIQKFALVIGNGDYRSGEKLSHVQAEMTALKDTLTKLKWTVTLLNDVSSHELTSSVDDFAGDEEPKSVNIVYYCGRLIKMKGEAYLVPIDYEDIASVAYMNHVCLPVSRLLKKLSHSILTIVILNGPTVSSKPNQEYSPLYLKPHDCVILSETELSGCSFTSELVRNLKDDPTVSLSDILKNRPSSIEAQIYCNCLSVNRFNFSTVFPSAKSPINYQCHALLANLCNESDERSKVIKRLADILKDQRMKVDKQDLLANLSKLPHILHSFLANSPGPKALLIVVLVGFLETDDDSLLIKSTPSSSQFLPIEVVTDMMAEFHEGPKALIVIDESKRLYNERRVDSSFLEPHLDMMVTISSTDKNTFVSRLAQRWKVLFSSLLDVASSLNPEATRSCLFTA